MKKILLCSVLLSVIGTSELYAQDFKKGDYIVDNDIDKFLGTWQWANNQDTFNIVLEKEKRYIDDLDIHLDLIIGWHEYVENGTVVESSMDKAGTSFEEATLNGKTREAQILNMSLRDINRRRLSGATLELLPGKSDEATWKLVFKEHILVNPDSSDLPKEGPKIPTPVEWTMQKIE